MTDQARGELVPGGLAIIIRVDKCQENLGKIVTVVRFDPKDPVFDVLVSGVSTAYDPLKKVVVNADRVWTKKSWLMPINPEVDPLSIDQRQECEA